MDVRATWGNNGKLTLHISNLRGITYTMDVWNERDQTWFHEVASRMLPQPTSDPVTFNGIRHTHPFQDATTIWGNKYKIYSTLIIYSGPPGGAIRREDFQTRVEGCFSGDDPHDTGQKGCELPPVVPCN